MAQRFSDGEGPLEPSTQEQAASQPPLRFAFAGRVSTEDMQSPEDSRRWQLRRAADVVRGHQFGMIWPLFQHHRVGLWIPELGGPVDPDNEAHGMIMYIYAQLAKAERHRIQVRVFEAMRAQAQSEGRFVGGRPPSDIGSRMPVPTLTLSWLAPAPDVIGSRLIPLLRR